MAEKEKQEDYRVEIGDDKRPYSPVRGSAPQTPSPPAGPSMAILSYCIASILMTLTNKYVLSGIDFNLNFMLLAIQVRRAIFFRNGRVLIVRRTSSVLSLSRPESQWG